MTFDHLLAPGNPGKSWKSSREFPGAPRRAPPGGSILQVAGSEGLLPPAQQISTPGEAIGNNEARLGQESWLQPGFNRTIFDIDSRRTRRSLGRTVKLARVWRPPSGGFGARPP